MKKRTRHRRLRGAGRSAVLPLIAMLLLARAGAQHFPPTARPGTGSAGTVTFERLTDGDVRLGGISVHRTARQVSFKAVINQMAGPLEVLIATPVGRLHESLLCADVSPLHLQTVLYLLGLSNGTRTPDKAGRQGDLLDIDLEWRNEADEIFREPIEQWVLDRRTDKPMERFGWVFVGSSIIDGAFQADVGGNLVLLYTGAETILDIPDKGGEDDTLFVVKADKAGPGLNGEVRVILTPRDKKSQ